MSSTMETPNWSDIPAPADDGAARHLLGMHVAEVPLVATNGEAVDLSTILGWTIVYAFPRTGRPGVPNPDGWESIPGASGCTPQTNAFRDHFDELDALGARVFGVPTQNSAYQREAMARLHLPFLLLSDADLRFARSMNLPTFVADGTTLLKRVTLVLHSGLIKHVIYPVFPPDRNAIDVIEWLIKARE